MYITDHVERVVAMNIKPEGPYRNQILADEWRNLDESVRQTYFAKYEILMKEYEESVREYEKKYGPIVRKKMGIGRKNPTMQ